jgi:uncharacterized protein YjbI with pentapeptide repeats
MNIELIEALKARWLTPEGVALRQAVIADLLAHGEAWPDLVNEAFPGRKSGPGYLALEDLRGLDLEGVNLPGSLFCFVDLSFANLKGCNLHGASFQVGRLNGADLSGSDITKGDLLQTEAIGANFDDCNITGAMMMSGVFIGSTFRRADLSGTVMNGADFTECTFNNINLKGVESYSTTFPDGIDPLSSGVAAYSPPLGKRR